MIEEIDNEAKTGKMYLPPTRDLHCNLSSFLSFILIIK